MVFSCRFQCVVSERQRRLTQSAAFVVPLGYPDTGPRPRVVFFLIDIAALRPEGLTCRNSVNRQKEHGINDYTQQRGPTIEMAAGST
jgi:hypothetical protein